MTALSELPNDLGAAAGSAAAIPSLTSSAVLPGNGDLLVGSTLPPGLPAHGHGSSGSAAAGGSGMGRTASMAAAARIASAATASLQGHVETAMAGGR